jgi:hypothetical protein
MTSRTSRWDALAAFVGGSALLLSACGGGNSDVATTGAGEGPAEVVTSIEDTHGPDAPPSSTTAPDGAEDADDDRGDRDRSGDVAPATSTTSPSRAEVSTTTAAPQESVPVLGGELVSRLFGEAPPQQVVLMWEGTLEVHATGRDPVAYENPLAGADATVVADQVVNWTDAGLAAAPLIGDAGPVQVPDGWTVVEHVGEAAIVEGSCRVSPIASVELRRLDGTEHLADLAVSDPQRTLAEDECLTVTTRSGVTLTVLYDAEGNAIDVLNASGSPVSGGDYAGYLALGPAGRTLAYTEHSGSVSPHAGRTVVLRDTRSGIELGRWSLARDVAGLTVDDRWIVATAYDASFQQQLGVVSIDLSTGVQRFVETSVRVVLP